MGTACTVINVCQKNKFYLCYIQSIRATNQKNFPFSSDYTQWELSSHKYSTYFIFYGGNCEVDFECRVPYFMAFKILSELCAYGLEISIKLDTLK
jgi:hypothetical protein